jgi:hypothetical protein
VSLHFKHHSFVDGRGVCREDSWRRGPKAQPKSESASTLRKFSHCRPADVDLFHLSNSHSGFYGRTMGCPTTRHKEKAVSPEFASRRSVERAWVDCRKPELMGIKCALGKPCFGQRTCLKTRVSGILVAGVKALGYFFSVARLASQSRL